MKFKIFQMFDLELEIAGGKREEFSIVGLLNESVSFKTKYLLQRVLKKIAEEKQQFMEAEKSLFESLGAVEKDGNLVIENTLPDGSPNPAIEKLVQERNCHSINYRKTNIDEKTFGSNRQKSSIAWI